MPRARPALLLALLALTACRATPTPPDSDGPLPPLPPGASSDTLLPDTLIIHPLTRFAVGPDAQPALIAHVELRDRFGQNARTLGRLRLALTGPADPTVWDVDLADPDRNALLYDDLVTRTYTITLGGLPETSPDDPPTLTAEFTFNTSSNTPRILRAERHLTR